MMFWVTFVCVCLCVCLFVLCSFHFFEQVTSPQLAAVPCATQYELPRVLLMMRRNVVQAAVPCATQLVMMASKLHQSTTSLSQEFLSALNDWIRHLNYDACDTAIIFVH